MNEYIPANYDRKYIRTIKASIESREAECLHCTWYTSGDGAEERLVHGRAKAHALKTGHTVDVIAEKRSQITSKIPKSIVRQGERDSDQTVPKV